jgi:hypothetical protein
MTAIKSKALYVLGSPSPYFQNVKFLRFERFGWSVHKLLRRRDFGCSFFSFEAKQGSAYPADPIITTVTVIVVSFAILVFPAKVRCSTVCNLLSYR